MKRLMNKKALITGGSSGIGQAIAVAYAREGADVVFSYNYNQEGAKQTLTQIRAYGGQGFTVQADQKDISAVYRLIKEAFEYLGSIDILVNNAGTLTRHEGFLDISLETFEQIQAVNLKAPFVLMQEISKTMQRLHNGGSIINISSISAEIITPGLIHYECSKAALHALTRGAASDLAQYNIRVNAIAPGLVETNLNKFQRECDLKAWHKRSSKIPLGRAGHPEDIACMAVFLASKEAEWITGSIISIDGGMGVFSPFSKSCD